ncbi:hypothetical protein ABT324_19795 [Saccharopolyspora sp. NPDC000359]|uniref:NADPH-dependent F420 reductase n=1 Tax=Saccharopolyspora sp. NPDC000359 TaxID=3154251 RepID=UPI003321C6D7
MRGQLAAGPGRHRRAPRLDGTVVFDATNQFASPAPTPETADLGGLTGSEYVASLLPGARVVKAFNALYVQFIAPDPRHEAGRQVLCLAGDGADAEDTVSDVVSEFGFAPVDLGTLREGGRLIQLGGPLSALHTWITRQVAGCGSCTSVLVISVCRAPSTTPPAAPAVRPAAPTAEPDRVAPVWLPATPLVVWFRARLTGASGAQGQHRAVVGLLRWCG